MGDEAKYFRMCLEYSNIRFDLGYYNCNQQDYKAYEVQARSLLRRVEKNKNYIILRREIRKLIRRIQNVKKGESK